LEDPWRFWKILAAGGTAGAVSRTLTAPVDRLKMLLQIQDGKQGLTLRGGLQKMAAEGTLKAYFRGNGVNVIKIAPETALKLTLNDKIKRIVTVDHPDNISPGERMLCGGLAGVSAQFIIYPLELVRTRLCVAPEGTYKGMLDCIRKVIKVEGHKAFYRGLVPSLVGILPFAGVDIAVFEMLKEALLDRYEGNPPPAGILASAWCPAP
jgi:solute carrier family 25 phosphate transporter 23/24/25/41